MNKTGIYIHIPFCKQKCRYCDFVSYPHLLGEGERYVHALIQEMKRYEGVAADSVYIGGGTPTALAPELLEQVLLAVRRSFSLSADCEVTVEANPGTCDLSGFSRLAAAGVNRVSLGVQSMVDAELSALGRIHTAEDAQKAAEAVRCAGIENLSLDFMFSIPLQTRKSMVESLQKAVDIGPEHLSCYSLILAEGTPMFCAAERGELSLPDDEEDRERYAILTEFLEKHGYGRYEISNFAKEGYSARHNTKYWTREPYIGLGAAAHSFYQNCRYENPVDLEAYFSQIENGTVPEKTEIAGEDAMAEFVVLGLRLTKRGICRSDFENQFGISFNERYGKVAQKLGSLGMLTDDGERICLTDRGIDVSNAVFCEFL